MGSSLPANAGWWRRRLPSQQPTETRQRAPLPAAPRGLASGPRGGVQKGLGSSAEQGQTNTNCPSARCRTTGPAAPEPRSAADGGKAGGGLPGARDGVGVSGRDWSGGQRRGPERPGGQPRTSPQKETSEDVCKVTLEPHGRHLRTLTVVTHSFSHSPCGDLCAEDSPSYDVRLAFPRGTGFRVVCPPWGRAGPGRTSETQRRPLETALRDGRLEAAPPGGPGEVPGLLRGHPQWVRLLETAASPHTSLLHSLTHLFSVCRVPAGSPALS